MTRWHELVKIISISVEEFDVIRVGAVMSLLRPKSFIFLTNSLPLSDLVLQLKYPNKNNSELSMLMSKTSR